MMNLPETTNNSDKSERKRKREQKRRTEVSRGLDSLADLVFRIDPSLKSSNGEVSSSSAGASTVTNRVELINSAVRILSRLHMENEERKVIITDLLEDRDSNDDHQVAVVQENKARQQEEEESKVSSSSKKAYNDNEKTVADKKVRQQSVIRQLVHEI